MPPRTGELQRKLKPCDLTHFGLVVGNLLYATFPGRVTALSTQLRA
jgi:hypothetical protein